ncbi:MAG: HpsJ family protein [Stigonema ocellatum SAG 48.90 = DSM 106950]|nr:HpsJ family protein [Stigonema ocellatum SAG 48.90 = DSM 106950]
MTYRLAAATKAARVLKVAGVILILSFLVDFLILLFPFQPTNRVWLIDSATALVDRGIVPMIGLGLLFTGYWIESLEESSRPSGIDLRFPTLIMSSILGLLFLLIFPLHLNNVHQASDQRVEQINKKADQEETQVNNQLKQVKEQLNNEQVKASLEKRKIQEKAQITDLIKNDQKYKQALDNPTLPQTQKDLLKKFKANPQEIDKFVESQSDPEKAASQKLNQIREEKEQAQKQTKDTAWKSGLRIGISSLLLAVGYIIIGWTGLRGMGAAQGSGTRAPAR